MAGNQWESLARALSIVYKSMDGGLDVGISHGQSLWWDYIIMPYKFNEESRNWILKFREYKVATGHSQRPLVCLCTFVFVWLLISITTVQYYISDASN